MKLSNLNRKENQYDFEFKTVVDEKELTIHVSFKESWNFMRKRNEEDYLESFGESVSFFFLEETKAHPYRFDEEWSSFPIHIPDPLGRELFRQCMEHFINETSSPMTINVVNHPGYPLLSLTYATQIMEPETVKGIVENMLNGIEECDVTKEEIEPEEETKENDEDDVDEDVVVSFELDDELREAMHEPQKEIIEDLEGDNE